MAETTVTTKTEEIVAKGDQQPKEIIVEKIRGRVKWFNVKRGYGFVNRNDNKEDLFIHRSAIRAHNPRKARRSVGDNEEIEFDVVKGEKGPEAANVSGPDGAPVEGSQYARDLGKRRRNKSSGAQEPSGDAQVNGGSDGQGRRKGRQRGRSPNSDRGQYGRGRRYPGPRMIGPRYGPFHESVMYQGGYPPMFNRDRGFPGIPGPFRGRRGGFGNRGGGMRNGPPVRSDYFMGNGGLPNSGFYYGGHRSRGGMMPSYGPMMAGGGYGLYDDAPYRMPRRRGGPQRPRSSGPRDRGDSTTGGESEGEGTRYGVGRGRHNRRRRGNRGSNRGRMENGGEAKDGHFDGAGRNEE